MTFLPTTMRLKTIRVKIHAWGKIIKFVKGDTSKIGKDSITHIHTHTERERERDICN